MKANQKKKMSSKNTIGYDIFYGIAIAVIFVISFFGNSFFTYEFFNSLFFDILYLVLIIALCIVRSIQTFLRQTTRFGKIFALTYYSMFALVFSVRPFVSIRLWSVLLFFSSVAAIILLVILAFKYIKAPDRYFITKVEPAVAMLVPLFLLVLATRQNYVCAERMWIPIVIIGIILVPVVLGVFLKYFKDIEYFKKSKSELIFSILLLIIACFYISGVAVTTVNYGFDSAPTATNVEIVDKRIVSGAKQVTSFYLKVEIDGHETEIDVPVEVYHSKEIGDDVEIKLYKGALGYSYYIYEYETSD